MLNYGVPGEKARSSATLTRFANAVASDRPEVVLLMHGYNDVTDNAVLSTRSTRSTRWPPRPAIEGCRASSS